MYHRRINQKPARLFRNRRAFIWENRLLYLTRALLAVALASQSFFGAAFLAWFQVERVSLDFLYNVLLLNLAFEAAQRTFKSFSLLNMNFCQLKSTTFRVSPSCFGEQWVTDLL